MQKRDLAHGAFELEWPIVADLLLALEKGIS